jgi:flavorubredoxin
VHPHVASAAFLTNILRPKMRWCGVVGSYGWGSRAADQIKSILQETGTQFLNPLLFKGLPTPANYRKLDEYIDLIAKNHETII